MARTHRSDSVPLQPDPFGVSAPHGPRGRERRPSMPNILPPGAPVLDPYATDPRTRVAPVEIARPVRHTDAMVVAGTGQGSRPPADIAAGYQRRSAQRLAAVTPSARSKDPRPDDIWP